MRKTIDENDIEAVRRELATARDEVEQLRNQWDALLSDRSAEAAARAYEPDASDPCAVPQSLADFYRREALNRGRAALRAAMYTARRDARCPQREETSGA